MKTRILSMSILAILLVWALQVQAGEPTRSGLEKAIRKQITYPAFAKTDGLQGIVMVQIEVGQDGKVRVIQSESAHEALSDYVSEKLSRMHVNELDAVGTHYLRFRFKYIPVKG